jgi:hypothetical protein
MTGASRVALHREREALGLAVIPAGTECPADQLPEVLADLAARCAAAEAAGLADPDELTRARWSERRLRRRNPTEESPRR